ncbi:MAG: hypothetical protein D6816_03005 [Bacteroidetes bacterium]|nr:MAG: hypothetical protein D6816_03005 [Bacteroidota bacterium]
MTNQQEISQKSAEPLRIYLSLATFGILYNYLIDQLEETDAHDFLVSLQVAAGVAVTLLFSLPFLGHKRAWRLFLAFVASGTPMIIGSFWRWHKRHELAQGYFNGNTETGTRPIHTITPEED